MKKWCPLKSSQGVYLPCQVKTRITKQQLWFKIWKEATVLTALKGKNVIRLKLYQYSGSIMQSLQFRNLMPISHWNQVTNHKVTFLGQLQIAFPAPAILFTQAPRSHSKDEDVSYMPYCLHYTLLFPAVYHPISQNLGVWSYFVAIYQGVNSLTPWIYRSFFQKTISLEFPPSRNPQLINHGFPLLPKGTWQS